MRSRVVSQDRSGKIYFSEFLTFTGDFVIADFPIDHIKTEYWLKCTRNGFGLRYLTIFGRQKIIYEYDSLYDKWADRFDYFKGLAYFTRYEILKEI